MQFLRLISVVYSSFSSVSDEITSTDNCFALSFAKRRLNGKTSSAKPLSVSEADSTVNEIKMVIMKNVGPK